MRKNLLIVDDSPALRKQVRDPLQTAQLFDQIFEAESGVQALEVLDKQMIGFVITDLNMPVMDGFKLIATVRQQEPRDEFQNIPIIIVSSVNNPKEKVKGLSLGANDYLLKPFDPEELLCRVNIHLKLKTLQEEILRNNQELERLSVTDELTGLYNRRYFFSRLQEEFSRANRYPFHISLLMIDVDHFKEINDTLGHQTGDDVLKKIARILQVNTRKYNLTARFGGDEFISAVVHSDRKGAVILAERLITFIQQTRFFPPLKNLHAPTLSIGIASYPSPKIHSQEEMVKAADAALYEAKRRGRNRVVLYEDQE